MLFDALGRFALGEIEPLDIISPTSIDSAEAFGDATVSSDGYVVTPDSIASAEAFGTAFVGADVYAVTGAGGIASGEAFETDAWIAEQVTYLPVSRI